MSTNIVCLLVLIRITSVEFVISLLVWAPVCWFSDNFLSVPKNFVLDCILLASMFLQSIINQVKVRLDILLLIGILFECYLVQWMWWGVPLCWIVNSGDRRGGLRSLQTYLERVVPILWRTLCYYVCVFGGFYFFFQCFHERQWRKAGSWKQDSFLSPTSGVGTIDCCLFFFWC